MQTEVQRHDSMRKSYKCKWKKDLSISSGRKTGMSFHKNADRERPLFTTYQGIHWILTTENALPFRNKTYADNDQDAKFLTSFFDTARVSVILFLIKIE